MTRSRSQSPDAKRHPEKQRERSRSPGREPKRLREKTQRNDRGFRWKEKRGDDREDDGRRLERGYRKRSTSPRRDKASTSTAAKVVTEDKYSIADKFGPSHTSSTSRTTTAREDGSAPPRRAAAAPTPTMQGEAMIIVHVNDRLGTKAAIPCLASDPIKLFKAQVAARIGREPHEILLKRQGERPFKDQLTLEDYGVSNGVQLDLEVDTGD